MRAINRFLNSSFRRKLVIFNIALVLLTTALLLSFLIYNLQTLTDFALRQNTTAIDQTIEEYLTLYAEENAIATWLQLKAAQDNLSVIGGIAQNVMNNQSLLEDYPELFDIPIFETDLRDVNGALSGPPDDTTDTLVPPSIADSPRSAELVDLSALLNFSFQPAFDGNDNNTFLYFVGDREAPITRAFPNIQLVEVLGESVDLLFWQDFFPNNVDAWEKWYTDADLQEQIPSPLTIEAPYVDAAGQGLIVTMFYPLWDFESDQFAGAVGLDISLNNIVENVLSVRLGESGFAFLMNDSGEIIAMPERGFEIFDVDLQTVELGTLSYVSGNFQDSQDPDVQTLADVLIANENGFHEFGVLEDSTTEGHVVAFASLPTFSNTNYEQDSWRIVVVVPEAEIFEVLNETTQSIRETSQQAILISIAIVLAFLIIAAIGSWRYSSNVTLDIRNLAQAAERVSDKDYSIDLHLQSQDEIGQLGNAFTLMINEIRDYTTNLEDKVRERTADLQQANELITSLNEKLTDENLRLGAELGVARQLQTMVLPSENEMKSVEALDIATYMKPADEVGGDYYDVFRVDDDVYLGIGDVTGHGLSSGVVMLMIQTATLALAKASVNNTPQILSLLNQVIYQNVVRIQEDKSSTLSLIKYTDRQFTVTGQHESVIICRNNGAIEEIDTIDLGLPVGLISDIADFVGTKSFSLEPSETLLLYTDGITEAENPSKEQYGMERMIDVLKKHHNSDANAIRDAIIKDVSEYIDTAQVLDDISMVVIKQR
jgi:sigma-B regulation protein RsbU (phosphoserine phosphatase)